MTANTLSNEHPEDLTDPKRLKWEQLARVNHGVLSPFEKLSRSRLGDGWIIKYEFYGGSVKSGSALAYVDDPENKWQKEAKLNSRIINLQRNPNQYLAIRCFDALPGRFLAMVGGTKQRFWSQLLFIPGSKERQHELTG